jgi:hypothetical protein
MSQEQVVGPTTQLSCPWQLFFVFFIPYNGTGWERGCGCGRVSKKLEFFC